MCSSKQMYIIYKYNIVQQTKAPVDIIEQLKQTCSNYTVQKYAGIDKAEYISNITVYVTQ